jgi:putative proteasome-type protease
MTYCVALAPDSGIVFISDSRTNAGVDDVSTYSKMYQFGIEGKRQFVILCSGNLATTQGVISKVKRDIKKEAEKNLMNIESVRDAADYIGVISLEHQEKHSNAGGANYEANFIIGGQVEVGKQSIFHVYPQGNNITTSKDTVYLQIGESKYGKPILDRIMRPDTSLETSALCGLVSMDSTMRSNLTVGPPIEVIVYEKDSFVINRRYRFEEDSDYLRELKRCWDENLKDAFSNLPPIAWSNNWDNALVSESDFSN